MYRIAYDKDKSTELNPIYFVYDEVNHFVHYSGTYSQCLCIVGAFNLDPTITLKEIKDKTNGFI